MKPFYQDNHDTLYCQDFRRNDLPDESVQTVVTSPPYFGLRKYSGTQGLIWGGDENCEHQWGLGKILKKGHPGEKSTLIGSQTATIAKEAVNQGSFCSLCGAWKGQLGLEPTMELYILHLIEILREVRRVLRKDGVCFLNLGDSYAGSGSPGGDFRDGKGGDEYLRPYNRKGGLLKPKDLCLIPERLAIAAQEDGWWVRSIIIWSKSNPMPESVRDRPTRSHEYIIMMTKSGTAQYWTHPRKRGSRTQPKADYIWTHKRTGLIVDYQPVSDRVVRYKDKDVKLWSVFWTRRNLWQGHDYYWDAEAVRELSSEKQSGNKERKYRRDYGGPETHTGRQGFSIPYEPDGTGRSMRSVWTFPTVPFPSQFVEGRKLDHFAVFPEKLPELCIKAATPEGCCSKCGAPWTRVVEKGFTDHSGNTETAYPEGATANRLAKLRQAARASGGEYANTSRTLGWRPTCKCNADTVPATVLDPFSGAGTTLLVAKNLNRWAIGFDTAEEYCRLAVERLKQQVLL